MSRIIVIGLTAQGLSLLRVLSRAGYQVLGFSNSKSAVGMYSKYGEKILFLDMVDLKLKISTIVGTSKDPLKCIIASGEMLALILEGFPELYDICDVESGPLNLVSMLSRKNTMYDFARSRGLPCADYKVLDEYEHGALGTPVVLKKNYEAFPLFKVIKIDSLGSYEKIAGEIPAGYYRDVIVQRYIDFDSSKFITYQCYVFNSRRCCEFVAFQRRRTANGLTCFLEEMSPSSLYDEIVALSGKLLSGLEYKGFVEIEYAVDSSGQIHFMETNTRVCGTFSALCAKYRNLADVFSCDLLDHPTSYDFGRYSGLIRWVNLARDLKVRLSNKDFGGISKSFFAAKDVLDWRDIRPFIMQLFR